MNSFKHEEVEDGLIPTNTQFCKAEIHQSTLEPPLIHFQWPSALFKNVKQIRRGRVRLRNVHSPAIMYPNVIAIPYLIRTASFL